jgi:outer membrane protein assembly factor BamB
MGQIAVWGGNLLCWLVVVLTYSAVAEWPQWRGPQRDGQVAGMKLPAAWPEQLQQRWQVEVGLGHSSPVVADGKIYVFTRRGDDESLACLNLADGKQLWQQSYPAPYQVNPAAAMHGKGPKSTPTVAGGRVITFGISGILSCWDAKTGKLRWRREFSKQFEKTSPLYGVAMSPAVDEDKCIVHVGGPDKGALMALNIRNGDTIWSCNEDGPGYASPLVCTLDDERQVVTLSQKACIGVDIDNGKLLWKIAFQTEFDQNAVTPLVHEGTLILSGINKGVERYRVEKADDEWETDNIWGNKEVSLYLSSPVADAERLFGFSHRAKGQFFAIDLTTGKTLWTSEGRLGDNASVLQAGQVLWALTSQGELIVFKASDKQFEQLARYKVAETATWAHPVILPGGVLVKDESKLTFWQLPKAR